MNRTPTTRGRHALRWVLGVGLVFVVVVGMALQVARSRASERWLEVLAHWAGEWPRRDILAQTGLVYTALSPPTPSIDGWGSRGGNVFREWRECRWQGLPYSLVLRQERSVFGSSLEARMHRGSLEQLAAIRAILAEVDVELVVEP